MNDGRLEIKYGPGPNQWEVKLDGRELTELMPISQIVVTLTPGSLPQVVCEILPSVLDLDLADSDVTYEGEVEK